MSVVMEKTISEDQLIQGVDTFIVIKCHEQHVFLNKVVHSVLNLFTVLDQKGIG